ncbi:MAG: hypothetical protein M9921_05890 [Fimbriimonadaceae bacterium]|nr:hypothetical protein [Fimbriimonadaceae bacterium]
MRPFLATLVMLCMAPWAGAQGLKIALLPPSFATDTPRLAEAEPAWVRAEIGRQLLQVLGKSFAGKGHQWASPNAVAQALEALEFDPDEPRTRDVAHLGALGRKLDCDVVLLPVLESISQKNLGTTAILGSSAKPPSETRVRVRLWAMDLKEGTMRVAGREAVEGVAKGPFFGTTRRDEMSGNPADKDVIIRLENRKRAEWIARAATEAIRKSLAFWLS